jgi:hypothetical protein
MKSRGASRAKSKIEEEPVEKLVINPSIEMEVSYSLRNRKRPFHKVILHNPEKTGLLHFMLDLINNPNPERLLEASSENIRNYLLKNGFLIPQSEAPKEIVFAACLEPSLLPLVPRGSRIARVPGKSYVVNEKVLLQKDSHRPKGSSRIPPSWSFPAGKSFIWVENSCTEVASPYWADLDTFSLVSDLIDGSKSPESLNSEMFEVLLQAHILVPETFEKSLKEEWRGKIAGAHRTMAEEGFAVVRGIIPPLQIAALRKYFRSLRQEGYMGLDPSEAVKERYFIHNDEPTGFFHRQTANLIRSVTQEAIFPSYSFVSSYGNGAFLKKHVDRPQCKWNASLLIDANPETPVEDSWPIFLQSGEKPSKVNLNMGDAVIYRGTDVPHWRDVMPEGQTQTLLLFHFVPLDFTGTLD